MARKVCIVITARPSYARVKTVVAAVRDHPDLELQLVVAASALLERYGSAIDVIRRDGFEPDALVYMVVEGENTVTMAKSTGLGLVELATVFDNLRPDLVVTIADRYETLAAATAASYMNVPTVHLQGGEVTGSIDEKVRHAVTKLSDIHLVCTERARQYVVRMGERPEAVHLTGCPSIDIAAQVASSPEPPIDPIAVFGGSGPELDLSDGYLVALQHPVTTEESAAFAQVTDTLHAVAGLDMPVLWFWPNVDAGSDATSKGLRMFRAQHPQAAMHFFRNLPPEDFLRLLIGSKGIVGNSSVAIREASYLGVPAVNIGSRQAGRERGRNVIDVPHECAAIQDACRRQLANGRHESDGTYGDGRSGPRIADLLSVVELTSSKRLAY